MLVKMLPLYFSAFGTALSLTLILERIIIPSFKKIAKQPIYEEGPSWHLSKSGTPTMGGIAFLVSASVALSLCSFILLLTGRKEVALSLSVSMLFALANGLVGLIDDMTKLNKKENKGLSPSQKLLLQGVIAVIYVTVRSAIISDSTEMNFLFTKTDLGFLYYPLAIFIILGIVNCANLTDGIDGLASTVAYAIGISLFLFSAETNAACAVIAATLVGASLGFLFYNINPAKIFMGDTGSLYLGALAVSAVFCVDEPLLIIPLGSVYVIEGISVILQVIFFKLTGKRIFKMAPLHHHLEKSGINETGICLIAAIVTLITSLFTIAFK